MGVDKDIAFGIPACVVTAFTGWVGKYYCFPLIFLHSLSFRGAGRTKGVCDISFTGPNFGVRRALSIIFGKPGNALTLTLSRRERGLVSHALREMVDAPIRVQRISLVPA